MNNQIIIQVFLFLILTMSEANGKGTGGFSRVVEYTLSYRWDIAQESWTTPKKNISITNDLGQTEITITLDYLTGDSISRTIYIYDDQQRLIEYYSQNYVYYQWVNVRKYILDKDETGKTQTQTVTDWKNGVEVYNRKQDYFYNGEGRVDYLQYYGWNASGWYESAKEYYYYNDEGVLVRTESFNTNGSWINRVFYEINEYGKRSRILTQSWANGSWHDTSQSLFSYDNCGYATIAESQAFKNGAWINQSRTEYFWKNNLPDYGKFRIPVCHNGHTIYISEKALGQHLDHGDCIGECLVENRPESHFSEKSGNEGIKPGIRVYPNPSTEKMTIMAEKEDCSISRIEIADMQGNIRRIVETGGNNEVTIFRENLRKGSYLLRIHTQDQIYSLVMIFN